MANIQAAIENSIVDSTNAAKRLRDFANTVAALRLDEPAEQLVAVLRQAADQVNGSLAKPHAAALAEGA